MTAPRPWCARCHLDREPLTLDSLGLGLGRPRTCSPPCRVPWSLSKSTLGWPPRWPARTAGGRGGIRTNPASASARTSVAGFGAHWSGLTGVGTDYPNVCYHPGLVWTSLLGHSYQRRSPPILEPLPDPLGRGRPPFPLLIPRDAGWEDSEIWAKPPPEPQPPPQAQPDVDQEPPPF